jgi:hypothetical protein
MRLPRMPRPYADREQEAAFQVRVGRAGRGDATGACGCSTRRSPLAPSPCRRRRGRRPGARRARWWAWARSWQWRSSRSAATWTASWAAGCRGAPRRWARREAAGPAGWGCAAAASLAPLQSPARPCAQEVLRRAWGAPAAAAAGGGCVPPGGLAALGYTDPRLLAMAAAGGQQACGGSGDPRAFGTGCPPGQRCCVGPRPGGAGLQASCGLLAVPLRPGAAGCSAAAAAALRACAAYPCHLPAAARWLHAMRHLAPLLAAAGLACLDWAAVGAGLALTGAGLLLHCAYFARLLRPPAFVAAWRRLVVASRLFNGAANLYMALAQQPGASLLATAPYYVSSMGTRGCRLRCASCGCLCPKPAAVRAAADASARRRPRRLISRAWRPAASSAGWLAATHLTATAAPAAPADSC